MIAGSATVAIERTTLESVSFAPSRFAANVSYWLEVGISSFLVPSSRDRSILH